MAAAAPLAARLVNDVLALFRNDSGTVRRHPARLGFADVSGFPYKTLNVRMPQILGRVIDDVKARVGQLPSSKVGAQGQYTSVTLLAREADRAVSLLEALLGEMKADKPLRDMSSAVPTAALWNTHLHKFCKADGTLTWYSAPWLVAECYMYGRIYEALQTSALLARHDPFTQSKQTSFTQSLPAIEGLAAFLLGVLDDTAQGGPAAMRDAEAFAALAQFSLWGNKSDLSLHASVESAQTSMGGDTLQAGTLKQLRLLQRNVLADCSPAVWQKVAGLMAGGGARARIDIVLDNAGYELFTDMCLAHWLVVKGACKAIKFHCKDIPWFVSDTSPADFHWLVGALQASPVASIARVGAIFQQHVDARRWIVAEHPFWTLPHEFALIQDTAPGLVSDLEEAALVILKGDLNYRKLLADRTWDATTPFEQSASFVGTSFVAFRTLKANLVSGLAPGVAERASSADADWLVAGKYGVIQGAVKQDSCAWFPRHWCTLA